MGILALVDYHLVEEICEKLKVSKGTFSGRLKEDDETPVTEGSALEVLKQDLIKAKKSSRKRKREPKKKIKAKSPVRFCQNKFSESDSDSESGSDSEFSVTGSSDDSDTFSGGEPENKFARKSGPEGFDDSSEDSHAE